MECAHLQQPGGFKFRLTTENATRVSIYIHIFTPVAQHRVQIAVQYFAQV